MISLVLVFLDHVSSEEPPKDKQVVSRWGGINGANAEIVGASFARLESLIDSTGRDSNDLIRTQELPCG